MQSQIELNSEYLLDRATRFLLLEFKIPETNEHLYHSIFMEKREQQDGSTKWVLIDDFGHPVSKKRAKAFAKKKWEKLTDADLHVHERLPSNRTDAHMKDTRFDTIEEAYGIFLLIKDKYIKYIKERRYAHVASEIVAYT